MVVRHLQSIGLAHALVRVTRLIAKKAVLLNVYQQSFLFFFLDLLLFHARDTSHGTSTFWLFVESSLLHVVSKSQVPQLTLARFE